MLEHIPLLKDALIEAFYPLYDQYNEDQIYACALVFNEYLRVDYLAISTTRSLFAEHEDPLQYLSEQDIWEVKKWRYRSHSSAENRFAQFKLILADYLKKIHIFGNPLREQKYNNGQNNLDLVITAFKQAKEAFAYSYGLDTHNIVFLFTFPISLKLQFIRHNASISAVHYWMTSFNITLLKPCLKSYAVNKNYLKPIKICWSI